jgi:PAS domain-containing protein
MARSLSELFAEIAERASYFSEPVLAYLCRMASLEARQSNVPLLHQDRKLIGIWDWDVPNDLNHMDPSCAIAFGATPAQGRNGLPNDVFLRAVHPQDLTSLMAAIGASLKGGIFETEYRIIPDDRERWVFAKGFCTLDKSMRPERFSGVVMEISSSRKHNAAAKQHIEVDSIRGRASRPVIKMMGRSRPLPDVPRPTNTM